MMTFTIVWIFSLFLRCCALSRPVSVSAVNNPVINNALPSIEVSIVTHLLAGAVARGVSILLMYPLDTLKTRFQVRCRQKSYHSVFMF